MSEPNSGFSRSNFAPLPHRHADLPAPPPAGAGLPPPASASGTDGRRVGAADEDVDLYRDLAPMPMRDDYGAPGSGGGGGGGGYGGPRGGAGGGGYERAPLPPHMARDRSWEGGMGGRRGGPGGGRDRDREREREREREMDPEREYESWERRMDEDRWGAAGPGARRGREWEDEYDRPKRRRSPSPSYPGPPSHRARLHSPSPPPHAYRSHEAYNELPDPASLEHQLTYRQFSEWFRASHPQTAKADEEEVRRIKEEGGDGADGAAAGKGAKGGKEKVGMSKRFERYRREYNSRQLYALYLSHRASPWFQERYSGLPEFVALRRRLARQGRVPTVEAYLDKLRVGEYDAVSYDLDEESKPAVSIDAEERTDKLEPDGLDRALDDLKRPSGAGAYEDDELRVEVAPRKGQVFIKTVPPTASRLSLEEVFTKEDGFQYLALTEPSTKKSFHRVGWAQFKNGVDVGKVVERVDETKIDSFTYHMGVNTAPVIGRTRLTQPYANTLERLLVDGDKAKAWAVKLEDNLMGDDEEPEAVKGEDGAERKADEEGAGEAGEGEGAGGDGGKEAKEPKETRLPGLRERGSEIVQERIDRLVEDLGLGGDEVDETVQIKRAKLALDHWLSYLRVGLSTCYYCIVSMNFPEELERKCILHKRPAAVDGDVGVNTEEGHEDANEVDVKAGDADVKAEPVGDESAKAERHDDDEDQDMRDGREAELEVKPRVGEGHANGSGNGAGSPRKGAAGLPRDGREGKERSQDERWAEYLDFRLKPVLRTAGEVDVVEYLGRDVEEETRKLCAPHIKQEEPSKYRCKECNKLFKAPEFVIKHIASKHDGLIRTKLEEIETFNNFAVDPHHIQILASTPAAVDDRLPPSLTNPMPALPLPMVNMPMFNPNFTPDRAGGEREGGGRGGRRRGDRHGGDPGAHGLDAGGGAFGLGPGSMAGAGGGGAAGGMNGLMQQQMMMMMQMQNAMMMGMGMGGGAGGGAGMGAGTGGGRGGRGMPSGPNIGQPGQEDPRARRGRVSYRDLDDPSGPRGGGGGGASGAGAGAAGDAAAGEDEGLPY